MRRVDYAGAFVYGSLTYLLCVWSKSLGACVVMHATANLLMGLYIMAYRKIRTVVKSLRQPPRKFLISGRMFSLVKASDPSSYIRPRASGNGERVDARVAKGGRL